MEFLIVANMILFLLVTGYAVYQFSYIIKTRYQYIKLGKKVEFDRKFKERFHKIWVMVFGQKKLLKDKKSGIIHVMMFYGFLLVQFGAIDFIWKGLVIRITSTIRTTLPRIYLFSRNRYTPDPLSCYHGLSSTLYRKITSTETRL